MSRSLYGFLALGALAIVLTDSDPALAPPAGAEAPVETHVLRPLRESRDHLVVRYDEPIPEELHCAVEEFVPPPPVIPEPEEVEVEPIVYEPPPTREDFKSTWTTDQEDSALDPEVQVKRIDKHHDVEAVFVIDTTGSMGWIFDTAREKALELVKALEASRAEGKKVRAALVDYKDRRMVRGSDGSHRGYSKTSHLNVTPLTSDWSELRGAFGAMRASGGGDLEEDTQGALLASLDDLTWTDGEDVTRLVYLIGDAPAKRYEDQPGLKALAERLGRRGFRVHAFNASDERHAHHEQVRNDWMLLSNATGGSYEVIRKAGSVPGAPPTVCRRPARPLVRARSKDLDLWIGPGDAEPELHPAPPSHRTERPRASEPRRLGGLGLEVWSDI